MTNEEQNMKASDWKTLAIKNRVALFVKNDWIDNDYFSVFEVRITRDGDRIITTICVIGLGLCLSFYFL
tara:strand:- start:27293 stop:27499 length:207 start_codon:yes stop_codon:yes gene_type:complete